MITIVDYGLGNIQAFVNIYRRLNIPVFAASTVSQLAEARHIILPGVGAFDWTISRLNASGLRDCLEDLVIGKRIPVLGVCVGLQMMARGSEEGRLPGLGWIDAEVKRFDDRTFSQQTHLPHMGWNDVHPRENAGLFSGIESPRFYFLHSYFVRPVREEDISADADYGVRFACALRVSNVYGTQFHPEKSHQWGIQLLKNFAGV